MRDIYLIIKDIESEAKIMGAAFDDDEVIDNLGLNIGDFEYNEMTITEGVTSGRLILMTIKASEYEDILKREEIDSLLEITKEFIASDTVGNEMNLGINDVINALDDCYDKEQWIEKLGLLEQDDTDTFFDLDSMIMN